MEKIYLTHVYATIVTALIFVFFVIVITYPIVGLFLMAAIIIAIVWGFAYMVIDTWRGRHVGR